MKKLKNRDVYYGCDSFDFDFFKPKPPKMRLQIFNGVFCTRTKRKGMYYFIAHLNDAKYIFNVTKLKRKKRYKNK